MNDEELEELEERAYKTGYDTGYDEATNELKEYYSVVIDTVSEGSEKRGFNDAEEKYTREMENMRYEFEQNLVSMMEKIKHLSKELYIQRKENATTIRTIRKSTDQR